MRVGIALVLCSVFAACAKQAPPAPAENAAATTPAVAPGQPAAAETVAVADLKPTEFPIGAAAGFQAQATSEEDKAALARTFRVTEASALAQSVSAANVLVLAPPSFAALVGTHGSAEEGWYSLGAKDGGADVLIQGTQLGGATTASANANAALERDPDTVATLANLPEGIVRSEGIVDVYFKVGNTLYNISVECQNPEQDPKCSEDEYVLGLARSVSTVTVAK